MLSLSRQNLPHLAGSSAEGVLKGAYTVLPATADTTSLILVASGSEVSLCVDVVCRLAKSFPFFFFVLGFSVLLEVLLAAECVTFRPWFPVWLWCCNCDAPSLQFPAIPGGRV